MMANFRPGISSCNRGQVEKMAWLPAVLIRSRRLPCKFVADNSGFYRRRRGACLLFLPASTRNMNAYCGKD